MEFMTIVNVSPLFTPLINDPVATISTKIIAIIIFWESVVPTKPPPTRSKIEIPIIQYIGFIFKFQQISPYKLKAAILVLKHDFRAKMLSISP